MSDYQEVRAADAEAYEARSRMLATVAELKRTVQPANLARRSLATVRNRPAAVASAVVLLGCILFVRKRLARSGKDRSRSDATAVTSKRLEP